MIVDLTVNINLDYLKKTVYKLLLHIYKVFCKTNPLKLLNKILEKYLPVIFLVKLIILVADSKNEFVLTDFSRFLLLIMTWEDCFCKPKLILAVNKLIYLDISISISKTRGPWPPRTS